jgi:SAM-dependent methyltransferase
MELEHVPCDLCQADDARPLFEGQDRLHGLPGTFTVVQCQQCGLIYLNPRPARHEIGAFYLDDYEPHVGFERVRHKRLARLEYNYGLGKRRRLIEAFVKPGRLLDVGCGDGSFLYYMREHGWQVYGQEINASAAAYACQELGLDVAVGELGDIAFPGGHFGAVTLWNVLEHLHSPYASLVEIRRILKPGGLLVVAVPNRSGLDARIFGPAWVGYDVPRHLYTFTPATLEAMLAKAGFQAVSRQCLFGSYQSFVHSLRFWLHRPGPERRAQLVVKRVASWRPLRLLAVPLFRLVDGLGKGSLITAACRASKRER